MPVTFDELYGEHASGLRRYAISLAKDADRADDLAQETLIRASTHMALLADLNPYQRRAWLNRTCKNLFLDELRSLRRREALTTQLTAETAQAQEFAGPLAAGSLVHAALELAPERYRTVLFQHYVLGMTGEEIARGLGVPAATVRSRLHLAVKWLRSHSSRLL
jgi:RNA polymerase sigma-70 factor (ECF subfamily)